MTMPSHSEGAYPRRGAASAWGAWLVASTWRLTAVRLAIFAVFLFAWEAASGTLLPRFWVSSPSAIGAVLWQWLVTGSIWGHLLATLTALALGYALGCAAGVALGLFLGFLPRLDQILAPYFAALYALPNVALAPLFILVFGIGIESKIALVALTVFLLLLYSTLDGVRDVDRDQTQALVLMGATRAEIARKLLIPATLPWIFTGMRLAVRYAFAAVIVGELLAANQGIGFLIEHYSGNFNSTGVFAAIAVLVVCCVTLLELLGRGESSTSTRNG
jgi:NitT/TauT family transport system permease protein